LTVQISIVIPVLDEAACINRTIDHLLKSDCGSGCEIIVVDGDPQGATIGVIDCNRVKKMLGPRGRGLQMNQGAAQAAGHLLLFLHADTTLPVGAFGWIRRATSQKGIVCGAFRLGIQSRKKYFRLIETIANIRTRVSRIPYGDQAIFIRTAFFHRIGGFKNIPIMEDVDLMRRIKKMGRQVALLPQKVQTSPRRWEKEGIVTCTMRNWTIRMLYLLGASPHRLAKVYPVPGFNPSAWD